MNAEHDLIDRYLDGEPTDEEETRLGDWLAADREHMRIFVREAHLHRQLRDIMPARSFHAETEAPVEKPEGTDWLSSVGGAGRAIAQWFALPSSLALRRAWLPLAACLTVVMGAVFWFFGPAMGQPALAEVHGDGFSILRQGQSIPVAAGMRLQTGDVLRTSADVTVVVGFSPEATRLTLLPDTDVKLAEMSRGKHFELRAGKLEASVARQRPLRPMTLKTPQAEARVVGTRFTLLASNNATRLDVTEGKVRLTRLGDGDAVNVGAGRYATVAEKTELAALPFTGAILRQVWSGVKGQRVQDLRADPRYPKHPDRSEMAFKIELQPLTTNGLGVRFCGYLHPPVTGDYEFWLAGATSAALYMSPDENPAEKALIAGIVDSSRTFDRPRFQGSSSWAPPVPLVAGRRYYVEAEVFINKGEGHLSVAWKQPGKPRELLTGEFLSPYKPN